MDSDSIFWMGLWTFAVVLVVCMFAQPPAIPPERVKAKVDECTAKGFKPHFVRSDNNVIVKVECRYD